MQQDKHFGRRNFRDYIDEGRECSASMTINVGNLLYIFSQFVTPCSLQLRVYRLGEWMMFFVHQFSGTILPIGKVFRFLQKIKQIQYIYIIFLPILQVSNDTLFFQITSPCEIIEQITFSLEYCKTLSDYIVENFHRQET